MAQFFPIRITCRFDTPGERRLAERLEKTQLHPQNSGLNRQRAPTLGRDGLTEGSRLI